MGRTVYPLTSAIDSASREEQARVFLLLLAEHDVADRIRHSFPEGCEFIEDLSARMAIGKYSVSPRQIDFLRGLCLRHVGQLPGGVKAPKRNVVWKKK